MNITVWEGYTQGESMAIKKLAAQFNATHPNITVTPQFYGNNDYALQKVLAAIAGGKPPDISYLYGSNAANIASSPSLVPLNNYLTPIRPLVGITSGTFEREVATVAGKVVGVPALVDDLALVYNKKLFAQAGIAPPTANWTWSDFERAAIKLTDPGKKQFGWAYVNDASEDTVWRFWAMLWQAGGSILSPDGKQAAFNSPAGVKALTLLAAARRAQGDLPRQRLRQLPSGIHRRSHRDAVDRAMGPAADRRLQGQLRRADPPRRRPTTRRSRAPTTGRCSTTARREWRPRLSS